jgi:sec-independent protein translocase protein TatC
MVFGARPAAAAVLTDPTPFGGAPMKVLFPDRGAVPRDDLFAGPRMPLGDHLEDLRRHLLRAAVGFGLALVAGFFLSKPVLDFLMAPVAEELNRLYDRRVEEARRQLRAGDAALREVKIVEVAFPRQRLLALGLKPPPGTPDWVVLPLRYRAGEMVIANDPAQRRVSRPPALSVFTITEPFVVYARVAIFCGLVLSCPWVFYQVWSFVAAGLYPHEKRHLRVYLPVSLVLFLAGVALGQFVVIPQVVAALLGFNEWLGLEPELRLSDWLGFALWTPLLFGIAFQTPLVMLFLCRVGVLNADAYRRQRRLAWFGLAGAAAVLSAAPDVFSMLALMVPLWALYELGICFCRWAPARVPQVEGMNAEERADSAPGLLHQGSAKR